MRTQVLYGHTVALDKISGDSRKRRANRHRKTAYFVRYVPLGFRSKRFVTQLDFEILQSLCELPAIPS